MTWFLMLSGQQQPWFWFEHYDVIKWKHFLHYWPFVRGIHWSPVDSPHKGQWCKALMFSLIWARTNGWAKILRRPWFEMPSLSLWRHSNGCSIKRSLSSTGKDFNFLPHLEVVLWYKMQMYFYFIPPPQKKKKKNCQGLRKQCHKDNFPSTNWAIICRHVFQIY